MKAILFLILSLLMPMAEAREIKQAKPSNEFTISGKMTIDEKGLVFVDSQRVALANPPSYIGKAKVTGIPSAKDGESIKCVARLIRPGEFQFIR